MRSARLALRVLALVVLGAAARPLAAQEEPLVVFVVRHAERADDGTSRDPPLSPRGEARARLLARMLGDADLDGIHVTPYLRTAGTAAPVARRTGIDPVVHEATAVDALAADLRRRRGRHLVVGHSNTVPALVRAFGGRAEEPIAELEYDRLYVVTASPEGVATILIRFGAPPDP